MPGFGSGPFGSGAFGEWPWSLFTLVRGIPSIHRQQDSEIADGVLQAMLEGLAPSLDGIRRKIRDYDDLRDPLRAPVEQSFLVSATVLKTVAQADGTSQVFISVGPDGDKFDDLRVGMVLLDFRGLRFNICQIVASAQASDVTDPPTDPETGLPTGKHFFVQNIGQASTELVPFVSGTFVLEENPNPFGASGSIVAVPFANIVLTETFTLDDGVNPALDFEFTVGAPVGAGNIAVNISGDVTDIDVATSMVQAINGATPLGLSATNVSGTSATVTIVNTVVGTAGNVGTWTDTVVDAGFIVTNPVGGAAGAFPNDPLNIDDGFNEPPYIFDVDPAALYTADVPMANNRVEVKWEEGTVDKFGFFTNTGVPGGDLAETSSIDYVTGQISLTNDSGIAIDADSIDVTYTTEDSPPPEDAEIRAQNILAFLAEDYGIALDRNDPESLQRSYVYQAFNLWDTKGTELGYDVLGQFAGYFVNAVPLNKISKSIASSLPSDTIFEFPQGTVASGSILAVPAASLIDGETFTLDDGVNPAVTFEFDVPPDGVVGGNVVVDISLSVTDIDVASVMVTAINGAASLDLVASNAGGTSPTVTITNATRGTDGNVTTWLETVADGGFTIAQPTGGTDGTLFTTVDPRKGLFDEIAMDALDLDLICSEDAFPEVVQTVTIDSVTEVRSEGSRTRVRVVVTPVDMEESFGTFGILTDASLGEFAIQDFERVDATSYQFEISSFSPPVVGAGTVTWKVFKFEPPNTTTVVGIGTDVTDLGLILAGFTGRRYRIEQTYPDPVDLASVGNWKFIDAEGEISAIESFENVSGTTYRFDIIRATPPAAGTGHIFYDCPIVIDCDFCRASVLLVRISPTTIVNFPEALEGDALSRLIIRLEQMIPAHVRIAAFVFDPGPAVASWGAITATTSISEDSEEDALYSAYYDEDEFPADEIPVDSSPIVATSDVTITNENVLEEYISGDDPLVAGTWTATGLWHITEYRSSTQFRSFNYGQNDVGRVGEGGAVPPDYDGVAAAAVDRLTSPSVSLLSTDTVTLRFRHLGDMRGTAGDDLVRVELYRTGPTLMKTIDKATLGLASGTNGSFTTYEEDISADVSVSDSYWLEFVFDEGTNPGGSGAGTGEGWYIDDVEIQVS